MQASDTAWLCSRYLLLPHGMDQERLRSQRILLLFKQPAPAEVVWQVFGGDAVKAKHPLLQPRVVGIDVLDMEDVLLDPDTCGEVDGFVGDVSGFGHGPIRGRSIGTKNALGREKLQEQTTERLLVGPGQHGIEMFALPILHHKGRNLLVRQSAFLGVPAAMPRGA